MMVPIEATAAEAVPDMAPKTPQAITIEVPIPLRDEPTIASTKRMSLAAIPPDCIKYPVMINNGRASRIMELMDQKPVVISDDISTS
ncbi:hypothetical protein GCM10007160_33100 [Litchfieldella qijiaojingensis]|uniref:Uncharacterized protein n=1 Tax=Litchfieldella qijiaojingensis TaxID=980347 RepID=A0ABQ2Z6F4_9GAMM|nr:hypothetical protein GCM10007160_33100 [Halomonas qijiaojingensis]